MIARKKSRATRSRRGNGADLVLATPLPLQLLRARDAVMQRFRPYLRTIGLTDQQGRILRTLAEAERMEMTALAERTCIHPASLSRIIPRLQRKGSIKRSKDPDDARRFWVSITKDGRALIANVIRQSEKIYADLAHEMGPAHMRELHRCLDLLISATRG